jgi:hypothetical protein
MSLSSGDEVPHIFTRKSRLQPGEFLISSAKGLLQHNRHFATLRCEAAIRSLSGVKRTCAPPISHPEPEWGHLCTGDRVARKCAYAQRAAGEQDAAIRTARDTPMRIEKHIDTND